MAEGGDLVTYDFLLSYTPQLGSDLLASATMNFVFSFFSSVFFSRWTRSETSRGVPCPVFDAVLFFSKSEVWLFFFAASFLFSGWPS